MGRFCRREGCGEMARTRSSYCSTRCRDADSNTTLDALLDPDAEGE